MKEQSLRETIFNILNKEPYKSNANIKENSVAETNQKIKDLVDGAYFTPFDENLPNIYAKDIIHLLWAYYTNIYITENKQNKPFPTQTSKEIKKDIHTTQSFIDMMKKNCIYNNDLERNFTNKQDDKFVYDYCKSIIRDLECKRFKKSQAYKISQLKASKSEIKAFFEDIRKEYPQFKKQDDIKQFIDSI